MASIVPGFHAWASKHQNVREGYTGGLNFVGVSCQTAKETSIVGFVSRLGTATVIGTMAIGLAACGSSGTTVVGSGNQGNATIKVKTNKGSAEINSGTRVPSGFPALLPFPTFLKLSGSAWYDQRGEVRL